MAHAFDGTPGFASTPPYQDPRPDRDDGSRRRLARVLDSLSNDVFDRIAFQKAEGGYDRAVLPAVEDVEPVAIRWPEGTSAQLHGHGTSAAMLRVVSGAVVEYRFVPHRFGYRFSRVLLEAGMSGFLPRGSFHAVVPLRPSAGLHAYTPALAQPTEDPADQVLPLLREALERDLDPSDSPLPPEPLAALGTI